MSSVGAQQRPWWRRNRKASAAPAEQVLSHLRSLLAASSRTRRLTATSTSARPSRARFSSRSGVTAMPTCVARERGLQGWEGGDGATKREKIKIYKGQSLFLHPFLPPFLPLPSFLIHCLACLLPSMLCSIPYLLCFLLFLLSFLFPSAFASSPSPSPFLFLRYSAQRSRFSQHARISYHL